MAAQSRVGKAPGKDCAAFAGAIAVSYFVGLDYFELAVRITLVKFSSLASLPTVSAFKARSE